MRQVNNKNKIKPQCPRNLVEFPNHNELRTKLMPWKSRRFSRVQFRRF